MDASAWIALAGLAFVVFAQAIALAFMFGALFNRMKVLESKPVESCKAELAILTTKFEAMEKTLSEVAGDLKGLLTGAMSPRRRTSAQ